MIARRLVIAIAGLAVVASTASAQATSTPNASRGYVEVVAQSAFGNVTSQSYGVEAGATIWENVQIFGEVGKVRNVATEALGASAQQVAAGLALVQSAAVTYSVKEPVTFFGGGVRYPFVVPDSKVTPYVLGGFGAAQVTKDVAFQLGGVAATAATLAPYVTIGTDLSGDFTKPMLILGGGVVVPVWHQVIVDLQYRFGRILADDQGFTVHRAGLGLGVRF